MKALALRLATVVGVTVAAGLSVSAAAANPSPIRIAAGWCAVTTLGSENCGFTTQAQCAAAVSGVGGHCRMYASVADRRLA